MSSEDSTFRLQGCLEQFITQVKQLRNEDDPSGDGFTREFKVIRDLGVKMRQENTHPAEEGKKPHNVKKNRYKDILPFDETRVVLDEIDGEEGSDYINANYIQDQNGFHAYVASQGPLPGTVDDFWRMVWQLKVKVIAMACRLIEMGKKKCEQYWPDTVDETVEYGDIKVTLVTEDGVVEHFTKRVLRMECGGETRNVTQFHYTGWPDHDIPHDFDEILEMMAEMRHIRANDAQKAPMVIHCSAGCGRTGTICVIDYAWDVLKSGSMDEKFSLMAIVKLMREQRQSMIQAPEQYMMAYVTVQKLFEKHLELMEDHIYGNYDISNPGDSLVDGKDGDDVSHSSAGSRHRNNSEILQQDIQSTLARIGHTDDESPKHTLSPILSMDTAETKKKTHEPVSPKPILTPKPAVESEPVKRPSVKQVAARTFSMPVEKIENIPVQTQSSKAAAPKPETQAKQHAVVPKAQSFDSTNSSGANAPVEWKRSESKSMHGRHVTSISVGKAPVGKTVSVPQVNSGNRIESQKSSKTLPPGFGTPTFEQPQSSVPPTSVTESSSAGYSTAGYSAADNSHQYSMLSNYSYAASGSDQAPPAKSGYHEYSSVDDMEQPGSSTVSGNAENQSAGLYADVDKSKTMTKMNGKPVGDNVYDSVQVGGDTSQPAPPIPNRGYLEDEPVKHNTGYKQGSGENITNNKKAQSSGTGFFKNLFTGNKTSSNTNDHIDPSDIPGYKTKLGKKPKGPRDQPKDWKKK